MRFHVLKQRASRIGAADFRATGAPADWIGLGGEIHWRGPSYPRDAVLYVPAGDAVIVWETRERFAWEANVSLGRTSFHTWTDVETGEEVSGLGLEMVRVAAFPCEVEDEELEAIIGERNLAGRPLRARVTLHPLPTRIGAALWRRIVDAAAEYHLDEEETGS